MLLNKLLSHGYLPKEFPPCFCSDSLPEAINIVDQSRREISLSSPVPDFALHSISSPTKTNRVLRIPNPIAHITLSKFIDTNWMELRNFTQLSEISKSMPEEGADYMRSLMAWEEYNDEYLIKIREKVRNQGEYVVKADIKDFYATVQKKTLKKVVLSALPQLSINHIESILRLGMAEQTYGLPVGPDWSFLFAELIMTALDQKLIAVFPNIIGFRFYDDFEFIAKTKSEAENILEALGSALQQYQLSLNWKKTVVIELPQSAKHLWMERLESLDAIIEEGNTSPNQINDFFEASIHYLQKYPQEQIAKWVISRISGNLYRKLCNHQTDTQNYATTAINYMIHILDIDVSSMQYMVSTLMFAQRIGYDLGPFRKELEFVLNKSIRQAASKNQENTVLWGIYACMFFSLPVYTEAAASVLLLDNPFIMILVFEQIQLGLFPFTTHEMAVKLKPHMKTRALYGRYWILTYEFAYREWIKEFGIEDYLDDDFSAMKKSAISFYRGVN